MDNLSKREIKMAKYLALTLGCPCNRPVIDEDMSQYCRQIQCQNNGEDAEQDIICWMRVMFMLEDEN